MTVTGVNDDLDDGDIVYRIVTAAAVSADLNYGGFDAIDVLVTNTDDDTAGITVTPTSGLTTTEAGGTATFTVVLNAQPTADVAIGLSSSNTAEGTVGPSLTFTSVNWNTPQTVTVTGVDDAAGRRRHQPYTIVTAAATSADVLYNGINAADVAVTNTDNDAAGITVTPTSGLTTTEAGGTATFTVVLTTQPTADVTHRAEYERCHRRHGQSRRASRSRPRTGTRRKPSPSPASTTPWTTAISPTAS